MSKHKTLDEYLLRDRLDDFDFTADIRKGLFAKGVTFNDVSWIETEEVVDAVIKPLRDEIKRLRELLANPAAQPAPGWISVKKRLPGNQVDVLICGPEFTEGLQAYRADYDEGFYVWKTWGKTFKPDEITLWQPLPAPPEPTQEPK